MSKREFGGEVEITGGEFRGRKLVTPGESTHPMGSREKLAIFNALGSKIEGAAVLDAYAGSGALGIEAISRGAGSVVFIDKAPGARRAIKHNIETFDIAEKCVLEPMRVEEYAQCNCPPGGPTLSNMHLLEKFDIILADPPYDDFDPRGVDDISYYLKSGGTLVLSHPGPAPRFMWIDLKKTKKYAGAYISYYIKH